MNHYKAIQAIDGILKHLTPVQPPYGQSEPVQWQYFKDSKDPLGSELSLHCTELSLPTFLPPNKPFQWKVDKTGVGSWQHDIYGPPDRAQPIRYEQDNVLLPEGVVPPPLDMEGRPLPKCPDGFSACSADWRLEQASSGLRAYLLVLIDSSAGCAKDEDYVGELPASDCFAVLSEMKTWSQVEFVPNAKYWKDFPLAAFLRNDLPKTPPSWKKGPLDPLFSGKTREYVRRLFTYSDKRADSSLFFRANFGISQSKRGFAEIPAQYVRRTLLGHSKKLSTPPPSVCPFNEAEFRMFCETLFREIRIPDIIAEVMTSEATNKASVESSRAKGGSREAVREIIRDYISDPTFNDHQTYLDRRRKDFIGWDKRSREVFEGTDQEFEDFLKGVLTDDSPQILNTHGSMISQVDPEDISYLREIIKVAEDRTPGSRYIFDSGTPLGDQRQGKYNQIHSNHISDEMENGEFPLLQMTEVLTSMDVDSEGEEVEPDYTYRVIADRKPREIRGDQTLTYSQWKDLIRRYTPSIAWRYLPEYIIKDIQVLRESENQDELERSQKRRKTDDVDSITDGISKMDIDSDSAMTNDLVMASDSIPSTWIKYTTNAAFTYYDQDANHGTELDEKFKGVVPRGTEVYESLPVCRVAAILEPLKVRLVTAMDAMGTHIARPLQKAMHSYLKTFPQFQLIGETVTEDLIQFFNHQHFLTPGAKRSDRFVSGDFSAATDGIDIRATKIALEVILSKLKHGNKEFRHQLTRILYEQIITYPVDSGVEPVVQKNGQLMGSVLSFPILCVINLFAYIQAHPNADKIVRSIQLIRSLAVRINGDDILFRCSDEFYERWKHQISLVGFSLSLGKNFIHYRFLTINSQPIELLDYTLAAGDKPVPAVLSTDSLLTLHKTVEWGLIDEDDGEEGFKLLLQQQKEVDCQRRNIMFDRNQFLIDNFPDDAVNNYTGNQAFVNLLGFINVGLLTGQSKVTGRDYLTSLPLSCWYSECVLKSMNPIRSHKYFLKYHLKDIQKQTQMDSITLNIFAHPLKGGLGFPLPLGLNPGFSDEQRRVASALERRALEIYSGQSSKFDRKENLIFLQSYETMPTISVGTRHENVEVQMYPRGAPLPEGYEFFEDRSTIKAPALSQTFSPLDDIGNLGALVSESRLPDDVLRSVFRRFGKSVIPLHPKASMTSFPFVPVTVKDHVSVKEHLITYTPITRRTGDTLEHMLEVVEQNVWTIRNIDRVYSPIVSDLSAIKEEIPYNQVSTRELAMLARKRRREHEKRKREPVPAWVIKNLEFINGTFII